MEESNLHKFTVTLLFSGPVGFNQEQAIAANILRALAHSVHEGPGLSPAGAEEYTVHIQVHSQHEPEARALISLA